VRRNAHFRRGQNLRIFHSPLELGSSAMKTVFKSARAFTIIELLIVVGMIVLVGSALIPCLARMIL